MPKLFLIRHANVVCDATVPSHEWQLSANGRSRTIALAQQFLNHPTRLITSTEAKAAETGQILANLWHIPCTSAPNLHEHDRRGVPYLADPDEFENKIAEFFTQRDELIFGNETAVQALKRFRTAVIAQLQKYPTDSLGIVTHGTVMTLYLSSHNPALDPFTFWQNLSMPDCYQLYCQRAQSDILPSGCVWQVAGYK